MLDIILFFAALAVAIAVQIFRNARARREEQALLARCVDAETASRVREIVLTCARDLRMQRAAGYGPWLSALIDGPVCIEHDERGRVHVATLAEPVAPGVALEAVKRTAGELAGSRFRLDALRRAERELEKIMGAGA